LIPREIYREAMNESIKNARMMLDEADIISERRSVVHARVLQNMAIEEVAKAYVCWLVTNGVIPYNHPLVDPQDGKSVFQNHQIKVSIYVAIANILNVLILREAGIRGSSLPSERRILALDTVLDWVSEKGSKKRYDWMYVDVKIDKKGNYTVSSPLLIDSDIILDGLNGVRSTINLICWLDNQSKTESFAKKRTRMREKIRTSDDMFPPNPEWYGKVKKS